MLTASGSFLLFAGVPTLSPGVWSRSSHFPLDLPPLPQAARDGPDWTFLNLCRLLSVVLSPTLQLSSVASTLFYAIWSLFAGALPPLAASMLWAVSLLAAALEQRYHEPLLTRADAATRP